MAKKIVKSKSMVTEEIHLNPALEQAGCEVVESDLGEYILQINDDAPSHIVAPALHKNKTQIRETFQNKLGYDQSDDPYEMTKFVRQILREKFMEADIGITGCNFAVANTGSICLVTNEGNADLAISIPDTHIAVMGMERIVPTMEELDILVSLLCRSSVGQKLTSYITVAGPKPPGERRRAGRISPGDRRQRPVEDFRLRVPLHPPMYPLRGVHQCLPGLSPHRRPFLRIGLSRAGRSGFNPSVGRVRRLSGIALRLQFVRSMHRSLSGKNPPA